MKNRLKEINTDASKIKVKKMIGQWKDGNLMINFYVYGIDLDDDIDVDISVHVVPYNLCKDYLD